MPKLNRICPSIVITGATASGKSSISLELSELLKSKNKKSEIINADSVQMYEGFDIGSGKLSESDLRRVKHHGLSFLKPNENYSAGKFGKYSRDLISSLNNNEIIPLIVGGTGLYINSIYSTFLDDTWHFFDGDSFLEKANFSEKNMLRLLELIDPEAYSRINHSDFFRIYRAMKLALASGTKNSLLRKIKTPEENTYPALIFIIERDRESLYNSINNRVSEMMNSGWVDEVQDIISKYGRDVSPLKSIGYKTISNISDFKSPLEPENIKNLINEIQRDTRRFAKRQITWWRNQPNKLGWVDIFNNSLDSMYSLDSMHRSSEVAEILLKISECFYNSFSTEELCTSENSFLDTSFDFKKYHKLNKQTIFYARLLIKD